MSARSKARREWLRANREHWDDLTYHSPDFDARNRRLIQLMRDLGLYRAKMRPCEANLIAEIEVIRSQDRAAARRVERNGKG